MQIEPIDLELDDALWAYRMAFKTPIGTSPYLFVFSKACYFSVKLKHNSMWALKKLNSEATKLQISQLNELDEFRYQAYDSAVMYKENMKHSFCDKKILKRDLQVNDLAFIVQVKAEALSRLSRPKIPFES
ncbi:uncharacterized protein LOC132041924 [Lycium ferocissimum]|uniref:uncharacterized protein LOC132041924 n=1 Tax=Lycium ferocissimum TaxID=112874 RepID=UPI0028154944|nr:uncharacterized protein LOC132041924 [Lycium ferocissimum]